MRNVASLSVDDARSFLNVIEGNTYNCHDSFSLYYKI